MFKYATLFSAALMTLASGTTLTSPLSKRYSQREDAQAVIRLYQSGAGFRRARQISSKIMMRQTATTTAGVTTQGDTELLYTLRRLVKNGNYEFRVINDPDFDLGKCEQSSNPAATSTVVGTFTADAKGVSEDVIDIAAANLELFDDSIDGVDDSKETILGQTLLLIEIDATKDDVDILRACGTINRNGNGFANRYRLKWLDQLDD